MDSLLGESDRQTVHDLAVPDTRQDSLVIEEPNGDWLKAGGVCLG
jgi:hypothetical protein